MENKDKYFDALKENNGQLNEIDLGEKMGLAENETRKIIAQLLSEYKIEYAVHGVSNYRRKKQRKGKADHMV